MRALIIGVDSAIGQALAEALAGRGDTVFGTTRRAETIDGGCRLWLDLETPDARRAALPDVDIALFCAAKARFADCRASPEIARRVNVEAPLALAQRLAEEGSRVLLLSTSAVFDGSRPYRRAEEPTGAASLYGRLKAEAEAGFLELGGGASVLRLTKLVTSQVPLFAGWIAALADNQRVRAFADLRFCPVAMDDVIGALLAAIDDESGGIYQVSGSDDITYGKAARHLAFRIGAAPHLVEAARAVDHGIPFEEVLAHTSLDTARLSALTGFRPPAPLAVLDAILAAHSLAPLRAAG
jgi:dTDP-4-dehydrorhamnose reductase